MYLFPPFSVFLPAGQNALPSGISLSNVPVRRCSSSWIVDCVGWESAGRADGWDLSGGDGRHLGVHQEERLSRQACFRARIPVRHWSSSNMASPFLLAAQSSTLIQGSCSSFLDSGQGAKDQESRTGLA